MSGRLFTLACQSVWAIQPDALQAILELVARENIPDFEAVAAKRANRMDGADEARVRNGVGIIPVIGPIVRRADFFSDISGATSVESLARDFNAALDNSAVNAILFDIDSPGGEVSGIAEFAQMIEAARGRKPITAYVGGLGASAAYWIASAADEIVADSTASLGSIGVVGLVRDPNATKARDVQFVSSQSPRKRPDPNTEAGRQQIQDHVDHLAEVFVLTVARNRGVSEQQVLDDFGRGGLLVGRRAVEAGLADRLGSFEATLNELAQGQAPKRKAAMAAQAEATAEDQKMTDETLIEKMKSLFGISRASATTEAEKGKIGTQPPTAWPRPSAEDYAAMEKVEAENKVLREKLAAEQQSKTAAFNAQTKTDAESFANTLVKTKALPYETAQVVALYRVAALLDAGDFAGAQAILTEAKAEGALPLVKALLEARPVHGLLDQKFEAAKHVALPPDAVPPKPDPDAVSDERKKELLAHTSIGRGALSAVK